MKQPATTVTDAEVLVTDDGSPATRSWGGGRPLGSQRDLFAVPTDVAYFNCASLCAQLHAVRDASRAALDRRGEPWRIHSEDWFTDAERRRHLFARLAGVDVDGVALIPATSYGLAVAAANLSARPGERVLVLDEEYPSNYYTWRSFATRTGAELVVVRRRPGLGWTEAITGQIDERMAVVAVPACHWTDGSPVDLEAVGARVREVGARLVVDGTQVVGAMPLDLGTIQPDFLVSVGYKWLLGPFGLSYLYVAPRHRDGRPLEENWILRRDAENFARLVDYRDAYQDGARRFDVGGRTHFELTPMANVALEQILAWGIARVSATLGGITVRLRDVCERAGLSVISPNHVPHMFGVESSGDTARLAAVLTDAGIFAGVRGRALRISPHLWVTDDDIQRFADVMSATT